jgi:hypothetical protein
MAYNASKASLKQTSYNVTGPIVAAFVNIGVIADPEAAVTNLDSMAAKVFANLEETFNAEQTSPSTGTAEKTPAQDISDPGQFVVNFGKHKGNTIEQIATDDLGWLEWLTQKDSKPVRNFARKYAQAYLDTRKAAV